MTSPESPDQAHEGILTATRGVHAPPEMRSASGKAPRHFVFFLLLAALLIVAAVGGVNALVDPYATVGTGIIGPAVWTDRAEKVKLIDRLTVPPQVIVLGSSRAMKIDPAFVEKLTGKPGFNAGVSSGTPSDAYVFTRFLHARFPTTHQTYLWMLDQEAFAPSPVDPGVLSQPQLSRYLSSGERLKTRLTDLSWLLSWRTLLTSYRTWRHQSQPVKAAATQPAANQQSVETGPPPVFAPNGFRKIDANDRRAKGGRTLAAGIQSSIGIFGRRYRGNYPRLDPVQKAFFQQTLAAMNSYGSTPLIVLSPVQPRLLAYLRPLGWSLRHRQVLAYLHSLQPRYRFVLVDFSSVASFGGSPKAFFDGVHMKVSNYRRLIRALLRQPDAAAILMGRN